MGPHASVFFSHPFTKNDDKTFGIKNRRRDYVLKCHILARFNKFFQFFKYSFGKGRVGTELLYSL